MDIHVQPDTIVPKDLTRKFLVRLQHLTRFRLNHQLKIVNLVYKVFTTNSRDNKVAKGAAQHRNQRKEVHRVNVLETTETLSRVLELVSVDQDLRI